MTGTKIKLTLLPDKLTLLDDKVSLSAYLPITTDAIKMKSNSSNALYMGIVEDLNIFRFEMVLLRDLDFQLRLAL
jgi:hypothetical protein